MSHWYSIWRSGCLCNWTETAKSLVFYEVTMYVYPAAKWALALANVRTNTGFLQVFMNIVLDDAVEEKADGGKDRLGMVVRSQMATSWGCGEGWRLGARMLICYISTGHSRKLRRYAWGMFPFFYLYFSFRTRKPTVFFPGSRAYRRLNKMA